MQITSQWALRGPHHDAVTDVSWHPSDPLLAAVGVSANPHTHQRDAFIATFTTHPLQLRNLTLIERGDAHIWGPESERIALARDRQGWLVGGAADASLCHSMPHIACDQRDGAFVVRMNDAGFLHTLHRPADAGVVTTLLADNDSPSWWAGGLTVDLDLRQPPPRALQKEPRYWVQAYNDSVPTWRTTWGFTPTFAYRTPPIAKLLLHQRRVVAFGTSSGTNVACNGIKPRYDHRRAIYAQAMEADTGARAWCRLYQQPAEQFEFVDAAVQRQHLLALGNILTFGYAKSFPRLLWIRSDGEVERSMNLHPKQTSMAQSMYATPDAIWTSSFGISAPPTASSIPYASDAATSHWTHNPMEASPISFASDTSIENVWIQRMHETDSVSWLLKSPRGGREQLVLRPSPSDPHQVIAFGYTDSDALLPWSEGGALQAAQWTDGYLLSLAI